MTSTTQRPVRVRFAPSPTGHLHIGGLRTALFNLLFARHHNGTYLLRVEDTDVQRSTTAYLESQLACLQWADLPADQPPVFQLSRAEIHRAAAQQLIEKGLAYPCFCAVRDADQLVHDLEQGVGAKYDGTCRNKSYTPEDLQKPHAVRYRLPETLTSLSFHDLILGEITVAADQLDDFVIIRQDGTPIYNFCVVIDDIFMEITHVIRGQDHVSNTPKQILFYQALGATPPQFAHLPLLLSASGGKLSKRDAAVSVDEYRYQGYLPHALCNYLVRLGWAHGDQELFSRQEMIDLFSIDGVGKKGSVFDVKKLNWVNAHYIRQATPEFLVTAITAMDPVLADALQTAWGDQLHFVIAQYQQRAETLRAMATAMLLCAQGPQHLDLGLIATWRTTATLPLVQDFLTQLKGAVDCSAAVVRDYAHAACTHHNQKLVALAQPLRIALTGSVVSPGVFELIQALGKDASVARIQALVHQLEQDSTSLTS